MLSFLLLCCGDIESNPGPNMTEQVVRSLESKVDRQWEELQGKLNLLIEVGSATRLLSEQLQSRLSSLESKFISQADKLQNDIDKSKEAHDHLLAKVNQLEEKMERQDRHLRKSNMILYGLSELSVRGDISSCVVAVLREHFPQKDWKINDIEHTHRLGSERQVSSNKPRPVLVKFVCWSDVMIVMRDSPGRERMREAGLRVGMDLTQQQRDTVFHYRQKGMHAFYSKGKLVVKESSITHDYPRNANPSLPLPHNILSHHHSLSTSQSRTDSPTSSHLYHPAFQSSIDPADDHSKREDARTSSRANETLVMTLLRLPDIATDSGAVLPREGDVAARSSALHNDSAASGAASLGAGDTASCSPALLSVSAASNNVPCEDDAVLRSPVVGTHGRASGCSSNVTSSPAPGGAGRGTPESLPGGTDSQTRGGRGRGRSSPVTTRHRAQSQSTLPDRWRRDGKR